MNRFDDAVSDLLAGAPGVSPVDGLRARARRRRRRRAVAVVAVVGAVSVGSVGVATSLSHQSAGPRVTVMPPTSVAPVAANSVWCVSTTRTDAVALGTAYGSTIVSSPEGRAKLVNRAELEVAGNPFDAAETARIAQHNPFWVVDLYSGPNSKPGGNTWGVVVLDANTHAVVGASGGSGHYSPYWSDLPDHGDDCDPPTAWCVSVSRQSAIDQVTRDTAEVPPSDTVAAKLTTYGELHFAEIATVNSDSPADDPGTKLWVVGVTGTVTSTFSNDRAPDHWGVFEIDADTGQERGMSSGPASAVPYWDAIPDHSSECPTNPPTPSSTVAPISTTTTTVSGRGCGPAQDCLTGPGPTVPPCPTDSSVPSWSGTFCGPAPGPGNGLGPSGECTGSETAPPCGPGMVLGKYYEYTLPGTCDGRLIIDGRHWISELPPPHVVPDMNVWIHVTGAGDYAGWISPSGAVGIDPDHGQAVPKCTDS